MALPGPYFLTFFGEKGSNRLFRKKTETDLQEGGDGAGGVDTIRTNRYTQNKLDETRERV